MMKILIIAALLWSMNALAIEVPRSIALGNSDFTSRSLSSACFGMSALIEGLPCNPAFTAKNRSSQFQTQFFFGNNVSYVRDVSQLLDGTGDSGTVERLFHQKSSSEMEAHIQASFLRETWGFSYSPYRLFYYSLIRNSALPVIPLYAGQEQSVSAQIASFAENNLYWGLQLRAVDRRFLLSEFTLTDALASGGSDFLQSKTQRALYIEPGVLYSFEEKPWKPQAGLTIKNAGLVDTKYEELPTTPDWHLAGSISPPLELGELELGLDLFFNSYVDEAKQIPRLGASYKLGAMQAVASYSVQEYSAGFLLHYDRWNGGLTYWRKKFENLIGEQDQLQTVYLELGFIL
jgi:hypothetical protein